MKKNIIEELKSRKLIKKLTNENKIIKSLKKENINIYCGFDPTYKSLHIGHLIPLITLKRFIKYKYNIIILIGEFTAQIGDPSFQKKKRKKYKYKKILFNSNNIIKQIKKILGNNIIILKNSKWFNKMKINFFLEEICNDFIVNNILNKKAIKKRNIKKKNINFKELIYPLLQSYDFLYLYKNFNTKIQIGGSDQWGNITSGINYIKKKINKKLFGITLPLIIKKNGVKYSKSSKDTIWLDKNLTTPYEFYQFWFNIPDKEIYNYFKQLTLINIKKIKLIKNNKNIYKIKTILAKHITNIVHGKKNLKNIKFINNIYFKKKTIDLKKLKKLFKINIPKITINKNINNLKEILILLKIVKTKSQSHNLIKNLSIKINFITINNTEYKINDKDKYFNKFTILKKGKKNFFLIKWI